MSREYWGTFSVRDHCSRYPFVREVMLYDRLVLPVPPDEDQRKRWAKSRWQPGRLHRILDVLGDRAFPVKWTQEREEAWRTRFEAGSGVAVDTDDWAFQATRTELTASLPAHVTGVEACACYQSLRQLKADLDLKNLPANAEVSAGSAIAILAREFLVPDTKDRRHLDVLAEAVKISSDDDYRLHRRNYWRFQKEFLTEGFVTDQAAIEEAVREMAKLAKAERRWIRRRKLRTTSTYAFFVSSLILGMVGGPLSPIGVGGAFLSVARFVSDRLLEEKESSRSAAAVFCDNSKNHLGWK